MANAFDVTVTAKMRNPKLWAAAKRLGGRPALAKALGVSQSVLHGWINLQHAPCPEYHSSPYADPERLAALSDKLLVVTGYSFDEVFPPEMRAAIKDGRGTMVPRELEITRSVTAAAFVGDATAQRLTLPSPAEEAGELEVKEIQQAALEKGLRCLTHREREIVRLRFGLGDLPPMTLEDVGRIFRVTKERIRGIEAKAIRKLERYLTMDLPKGCIPGDDNA